MITINKEAELLKDWAVQYIKQKDIFLKSIVSIDVQNNKITATYKTKKQIYVILPELSDINGYLDLMKDGTHVSLVVFNTLKNLEIVIKNWSRLSEQQLLSIFFVNPFSTTDKRWILFPYTHNKISDESTLTVGLRSLFEGVEPYNPK